MLKYYFMIIFLSLLSISIASSYPLIEPISIEERPVKKVKPIVKVVKKECKITTTVVLIENEKSQNSIVIKTTKGESVVNTPNYFVSICTKDIPPTAPEPISQEKINLLFADVVSVKYKKPIFFILYFNEKELTSASKKKICDLIREISDRRDSYIKITGHTDTMGSFSANKKLAKERADIIAKIIKSSHAEHQSMSIESYGEDSLAIDTEDEMVELLNRRVEILIQ